MNPSQFVITVILLLAMQPSLAASDGEAPLQVDADRWEADQTREISVFQGNVVLRKGSILIKAEEARIKAVDGRVQFGTIIGSPATFEQAPETGPTVKGRADRIEYDAENDLVILTGTAWVSQGDDEFSGETIRYDLLEEKVLATGNEKTPQRVRIIFTPREDAPPPSTVDPADDASDDETTDNGTVDNATEYDAENR